MPAKTLLILLWTLTPGPLVWYGLYELKSIFWAFALYHGLCLLPAIIAGRKLWQDCMQLPAFKQVAIIAAAALVFSAVTALTYELFGQKLLSDTEVISLLLKLGYHKENFAALSIYLVLVNPFLEELFWRGIVYKHLQQEKFGGKHFALFFSSLMYAAYHYVIFRLVLFPFWAELGILMLAGFGAALCFVFRRTASIISTALLHAFLTDAAVIVLMLLLMKDNPGAL